MLQLTRAALVCPDAGALEAMRRSFDASNAILLPRFLDAELLGLVRQAVRDTPFSDRKDEGLAYEECMDHNNILGMLHLIMNDPRVFEAIRRVTRCPSVGSFAGRIYRMRAGVGHFDRWHSDMDGARLIGVSVNLTEGTFDGGQFELRPAGSHDTTWSVANVGPGDAILFRISETLQHRVSDVRGEVPKVALAGWFQARPDFLAVLKSGAESAETREVY